MRHRPVVLALVVMLAAVGLPAFAPAPDGPPSLGEGCVEGSAGDAAASLLGADAELVEVQDGTALVLTPGVYPGVRNRMVATDAGAWCTAEALNVSGLLGDAPVDAATTAATYLAAPFFDGVTVSDATEVAPGVVELTTHARTNGVVADWVVHVDAQGVRAASWRATDFAVEPFEAQYEGLTALPGATWSYVRGPAGLLEPTRTIQELAAQAEAGDPSPTTSVETPDGFTIHVHESDALFVPQAVDTVTGVTLPRVHTGLGPDAGTDTGVTQADFVRIMAEAAEVNAADFHDWGWRKGWIDDEGAIYVDSALAGYCIACVLVSEHFNVHMNRAVLNALGALGYSYPEGTERLALINVVGHEMVHNYQNAYGKPQSVGGGRHSSYSEGMARFSETLHDYSHISHQPNSLVYANDSNGCNGWQGGDADAAFAAGPLTGQSYDSCYFWMTAHAAHGIDAFVGIMEQTEGLPNGRPWEIYAEAIEAGTGAPLEGTLANFAAMALTGDGYVWGNPTNPESEQFDWARPYLDRWMVADSAAVGDTLTSTLVDGGMDAWRLAGSATVDVSDDDGHAVALVVDHGANTEVQLLGDGDLAAVDPGDDAWIVLLNASTTRGEVSVTLSEAPTG